MILAPANIVAAVIAGDSARLGCFVLLHVYMGGRWDDNMRKNAVGGFDRKKLSDLSSLWHFLYERKHLRRIHKTFCGYY